MTPLALLLVTTDPALETLLLQRLHTPPLALRARASSVSRAIERAARGDFQAVVVTAGTRDLTPATLATLQERGTTVVIITSSATEHQPSLAAATGALWLSAAALHDSVQPLIDLLQPAMTTDDQPAPATTPGPAIPWSRRWQTPSPLLVAVPTPADTSRGRLIAVLSVRGGSGGSFVARGLAAQLARPARTAVWLLDLDPAGDSQVAALSLSAQTGLTPLAIARPRHPEDWQTHLEQELTVVGPALRVLPGLARATDAVHLTPELISGLLDSAHAAAAWTLLDLGRPAPPSAAPWQPLALERADLTLLVVRAHWPSLLAARRVLTELAVDRPIGLVLNDVEVPPTAAELNDIGQALEQPVVAVIPSDRAAVLQPLLLTPSPARQALTELAARLSDAAAATARGRSTLLLPGYVPITPASTRRWFGRRPAVTPVTAGGAST